ncbi:hypothetical protein, partial [Methanoculleus sp. MH98A]|uniref:hypothetical protein n=1 Tax=Methanoculleus sp. MH98A TaxID=1495314 RepID=UPI00064FCB88
WSAAGAMTTFRQERSLRAAGAMATFRPGTEFAGRRCDDDVPPGTEFEGRRCDGDGPGGASGGTQLALVQEFEKNKVFRGDRGGGMPPSHLTVVELRAFRPSHSPSAPPQWR